MNTLIVLAAGGLCAAGFLLMLSPTILKRQQSRGQRGTNNGALAFRLPDWIGHAGLTMVGLSVLLAFTSLIR